MIKNRMQLVRFELAFLQEIHHASDASEREGTIRHERNRCVKLEPGIRGKLYGMPNIDRRNQGKTLEQQYQRRRERSHKRKAICRSHQDIDQSDRPREKDKNLKKICNWTTSQLMAADPQEGRLENKTQSDRKEIEPQRAKHFCTQFDDRVYNRGQKTKSRNNEKITVHWDRLF